METEKVYIGIDNGVTGSIGVLCGSYSQFILTPTKKEQSYTVAKKLITRVDVVALRKFLKDTLETLEKDSDMALAVLERPLINPSMFSASVSASRALEAVLCVLEDLGIPLMYTDSKKWQRELLPKGVVGSTELKKASKDIAGRLYPQHQPLIQKHKDGDGILIATWAKRACF